MTSFRPFAHQGNPALGNGEGFGTPSKIDNQIWRISSSLKGTLGLSDPPAGTESFGYQLDLDNAHGSASFRLDHAASPVRLRLVGVTIARLGRHPRRLSLEVALAVPRAAAVALALCATLPLMM